MVLNLSLWSERKVMSLELTPQLVHPLQKWRGKDYALPTRERAQGDRAPSSGFKTCTKPVLIAHFSSSYCQNRWPREVVPKLGCSLELSGELSKDAEPSSTSSYAHSQDLGSGDSQADGPQGCEATLSLERTPGRCPVHGSPEGDVGRPPYWPFLPDSCFPWQVMAREVKRHFSPQWTFILDLLLLNQFCFMMEIQMKQKWK